MDKRHSQLYDITLARTFKLINHEVSQPTAVLNLSSYVLTDDQARLLSKGAKFIPKPPKANKKEIVQAILDFKRRLKIRAIICTDKQDPNPLNKLLRPESTWDTTDETVSKDFAKMFKSLEKKINRMKIVQSKKQNLSQQERKALKSLRKNKNIVIKPADKGTTLVIMNRADYIQEGERQLSNDKFYKKINKPIYPDVRGKYNQIIDNIRSKSLLTKKQTDYLEPDFSPRERKFYLLPKIHKECAKWSNNGTMPPGRPIVSDCDSDTYRLSTYIDYFLNPISTRHPSYIKDTSDFLSKLSNIAVHPSSLLITLDVESLYTNINNTSGIEAVHRAFQANPDSKRPDNEIIELLMNSLKNNDFIFNNQWYLQTGGTAMGKKFAPSYANIFMAKWESEALQKCQKHPQTYFRYLDDIFMVWPHSKEEFEQFFEILNSHDTNIKLKYTISEKEVNFLDVTVFKGEQCHTKGQLDTKVYFKPTDTHELLHKSSYHPKHTFKSIVKSQIIRFHRICTHSSDFHKACSTLFSVLRKRQYSNSFLRKIKRDTLFGLNRTGSSSMCNETRCKTCQHIQNSNVIYDKNNLPIKLTQKLDCNSTNLVYLIQCGNCGTRYVGETSRKLKERITQHRSDVNNQSQTPVANHFNGIDCNLDNLQVVPLEQVKLPERDAENVSYIGPLTREEAMSLDVKLGMTNKYLLLDREHYWITRLKTLYPQGLNMRTEVGPPIPFTIKFSDVAPAIANMANNLYLKLKSFHYGFRTNTVVTAFKRNKNLKDYLVSASLH